jgi:hypothetical protein
MSLVVAAADVVEDHASLLQVAASEFALNACLVLEQPIQGLIQRAGLGIGHVKFVGQGGAVPVAQTGQLGTGEEQALSNHGQDQGTGSGGSAGQQGRQLELLQQGQDGFDVSVRFAVQDANGIVRSHQGLALQSPANHLDDRLGQVREIGQGVVLDFAVLAIRLTE